jgi:hypothetical protein
LQEGDEEAEDLHLEAIQRVSRRTLFPVILILLIFLICDTILYVGLSYVESRKHIFYRSTTISSKDLERFLDTRFDPLLGWDIHVDERSNLGTRGSRDYPERPKYRLKAFGDSFVYGAEVTEDETLCALMEDRTGWDCLNYGVGGHGPDQALLKYRANRIPTDYTILGILCENIGRVVSYYPAFYMREWAPPKPRFIKSGDDFRLLESPIRNRQEALKLLDGEFIETLKAHDYWPHYYEEVLGAPERLGWPATWTVLKHLRYFTWGVETGFKRRFGDNYDAARSVYKYTHLYEPSSEALAILEHILDEFVALAGERGEVPIILFFADQFSLDLMRDYGRFPHAPITAYAKEAGYHTIDFGEALSGGDYAPYFLYYNSHYSPAGNERVAAEVVRFIEELEGGGTGGNSVSP